MLVNLGNLSSTKTLVGGGPPKPGGGGGGTPYTPKAGWPPGVKSVPDLVKKIQAEGRPAADIGEGVGGQWRAIGLWGHTTSTLNLVWSREDSGTFTWRAFNGTSVEGEFFFSPGYANSPGQFTTPNFKENGEQQPPWGGHGSTRETLGTAKLYRVIRQRGPGDDGADFWAMIGDGDSFVAVVGMGAYNFISGAIPKGSGSVFDIPGLPDFNDIFPGLPPIPGTEGGDVPGYEQPPPGPLDSGSGNGGGVMKAMGGSLPMLIGGLAVAGLVSYTLWQAKRGK